MTDIDLTSDYSINDLDAISKQAIKELEAEDYRKQVDKYKEKLRSKKWYHKLIPFKIIIIRRETDGSR